MPEYRDTTSALLHLESAADRLRTASQMLFERENDLLKIGQMASAVGGLVDVVSALSGKLEDETSPSAETSSEVPASTDLVVEGKDEPEAGAGLGVGLEAPAPSTSTSSTVAATKDGPEVAVGSHGGVDASGPSEGAYECSLCGKDTRDHTDAEAKACNKTWDEALEQARAYPGQSAALAGKYREYMRANLFDGDEGGIHSERTEHLLDRMVENTGAFFTEFGWDTQDGPSVDIPEIDLRFVRSFVARHIGQRVSEGTATHNPCDLCVVVGVLDKLLGSHGTETDAGEDRPTNLLDRTQEPARESVTAPPASVDSPADRLDPCVCRHAEESHSDEGACLGWDHDAKTRCACKVYAPRDGNVSVVDVSPGQPASEAADIINRTGA